MRTSQALATRGFLVSNNNVFISSLYSLDYKKNYGIEIQEDFLLIELDFSCVIEYNSINNYLVEYTQGVEIENNEI